MLPPLSTARLAVENNDETALGSLAMAMASVQLFRGGDNTGRMVVVVGKKLRGVVVERGGRTMAAGKNLQKPSVINS